MYWYKTYKYIEELLFFLTVVLYSTILLSTINHSLTVGLD